MADVALCGRSHIGGYTGSARSGFKVRAGRESRLAHHEQEDHDTAAKPTQHSSVERFSYTACGEIGDSWAVGAGLP